MLLCVSYDSIQCFHWLLQAELGHVWLASIANPGTTPAQPQQKWDVLPWCFIDVLKLVKKVRTNKGDIVIGVFDEMIILFSFQIKPVMYYTTASLSNI